MLIPKEHSPEPERWDDSTPMTKADMTSETKSWWVETRVR